MFDPRQARRIAQFLKRLDTDTELVGGLANGVGRFQRAVDQRRQAADRGDAGECAGQKPDAAAQRCGALGERSQATRGDA